MKDSNVAKLRNALMGKRVTSVETHGGHGMVLTICFETGTSIDICTYDDGKKHDVDEFYVALDDVEL